LYLFPGKPDIKFIDCFGIKYISTKHKKEIIIWDNLLCGDPNSTVFKPIDREIQENI